MCTPYSLCVFIQPCVCALYSWCMLPTDLSVLPTAPMCVLCTAHGCTRLSVCSLQRHVCCLRPACGPYSWSVLPAARVCSLWTMCAPYSQMCVLYTCVCSVQPPPVSSCSPVCSPCSLPVLPRAPYVTPTAPCMVPTARVCSSPQPVCAAYSPVCSHGSPLCSPYSLYGLRTTRLCSVQLHVCSLQSVCAPYSPFVSVQFICAPCSPCVLSAAPSVHPNVPV